MKLRDIFRECGTDKWEHGYHAIYETRKPPRRMLEVGVLHGHSLRAWRAVWPDAFIYGMDTFTRRVPIKPPSPMTFIARWDSREPLPDGHAFDVPDSWDLIVDDGSHLPRDQAATFRALWPRLASGGRYFIEDVWIDDEDSRLHPWVQARAEHFSAPCYRDLWGTLEGLDVTRHDLRAEHKPDSYLLEIVKP